MTTKSKLTGEALCRANDTNGDGNCGRQTCRICHPENFSAPKLTGEALRIKVAEIIGWHEDRRPNGNWWIDAEGFEYPPNEMPVPDYCRSLDAIASAERTLSDEEHKQFRLALQGITKVDSETWRDNDGARRAYISATAEQRARAFVMVKEGRG